MAASTASHRPIKGILKNRSSVLAPAEQPRRNVEELHEKSQRWDDVNILASYQPAGEECGLVTAGGSGAPRHHAVEAVGGEDDARSDPGAAQAWTPHVSARKVAAAEGSQPRCQTREQECSEGGHTDLSLEEQEKKRQFEMKRKLHYNEGLNIKLARQLLSKDLHDDEEDEEMLETTDGECMNIEESN